MVYPIYSSTPFYSPGEDDICFREVGLNKFAFVLLMSMQSFSQEKLTSLL